MNNLLTGATSEAFAKWYRHNPEGIPGMFKALPDLVKLAYYVAFFDEHGLEISPEPIYGDEFRAFIVRKKGQLHYWLEDRFSNRSEALTAAVKKANEIMNLKIEKDGK